MLSLFNIIIAYDDKVRVHFVLLANVLNNLIKLIQRRKLKFNIKLANKKPLF